MKSNPRIQDVERNLDKIRQDIKKLVNAKIKYKKRNLQSKISKSTLNT